jgi:hypothetical protein
MYRFPFLLLKQRLEQEVPGLKETDWYMRQYAESGKGTLYTTPACYIEFLPVDPETMGGGKIQQAVIRFRIHTVTTNLHDNHKRIHDPNAAINHLDYVDMAFAALQGFRAKLSQLQGFDHLAGTEKDYRVMNSIDRKSIVGEHKLDKLMVTVQEFSCLCYDVSANLTYVHRSTPPDLKINS